MSSQRLVTALRCLPAGFACAVWPRRSRAQQSPGLSAAWGCSRSPSHSGIPLPAPRAARAAVSWLCQCRPAAVSWKARGDISANASQTRSDTSVVMCRLTLSSLSLLSQPLPRAPESRQVGQVRPSRVRVVSAARGLLPVGAGNARAPPWALCMWLRAAASAEALGHLCLPIRRLIPSCIGAPLPNGPSKCDIDIFVRAEGEWQWSTYGPGWILHTLQYPHGKHTNHCSATQGLLFLVVWHLLALIPGGGPEGIFLPCFTPRSPQPPWKGPAWSRFFSHPEKNVSLTGCACEMRWLASSTASAQLEEAALNSPESHCQQLLELSAGQTYLLKYSTVTRAEGCSTLPEQPEINGSRRAPGSESTHPA